MSKKNAYTFYVEERCRQTRKSVPEGYGLFGKEWESMDPARKQRYFRMSEQSRSPWVGRNQPSTVASAPFKDKNSGTVRQTNCGAPLSKSSSSEASAAKVEPRKMADIIMDVSHAGAEVVVNPNTLSVLDFPSPRFEELDEKFQDVIALQYPDPDQMLMNDVLVVSCAPLFLMDKNLKEVNRPVEIAVESFKLGIGYTGKIFHEFIHPSDIPPGWTFFVSDARKKYHKIPASTNVVADPDSREFHKSFKLNDAYYGIYVDLLKAIGNPDGGHFPLMASATEVCVVVACLRWLQNMANLEARRNRRPELPAVTVSTVEEFCMAALPSEKVNMDELRTLTTTLASRRYHHEVALRCEFHKLVDSEVCAMGTAKDKIFLTFDYLRGLFGLPAEGAFIPQFENY